MTIPDSPFQFLKWKVLGALFYVSSVYLCGSRHPAALVKQKGIHHNHQNKREDYNEYHLVCDLYNPKQQMHDYKKIFVPLFAMPLTLSESDIPLSEHRLISSLQDQHCKNQDDDCQAQSGGSWNDAGIFHKNPHSHHHPLQPHFAANPAIQDHESPLEPNPGLT